MFWQNTQKQMIFRAPKIKLIFEFVSAFRLVFSCFTALGPRKTQQTKKKTQPPPKKHAKTNSFFKERANLRVPKGLVMGSDSAQTGTVTEPIMRPPGSDCIPRL